MKTKLILSGLILAASQLAFAITVTPTDNANTLANSIVGAGVTLNSATYSGASGSSGTFTGGLAHGLGIDSGIVLTSGQASIAAQPNNSGSATANNGFAGSSMLDALIPGYTTYDATILTLNFSTAGGSLYFNYVFASEEYNEYVNTGYNDVFGFFLDGTAVTDNVALIPSTTTPVSINNINNGLNSTYYRDNANALLAPNIQYDGLTTMLTVGLVNLAPGDHTIKLAIADAGDHVLDSAVFIQGKSFSDQPGNPDDDVPDSTNTLALLSLGFSALWLLRRKL